MRAKIKTTVMILVILCGFGFFNKTLAANEGEKRFSPLERLYLTYSLTLELIEKKYLKGLSLEQIKNIKEIQEESLSKIVSELDKYSSYHNTEEWRRIETDSQKRFGGVGLATTVPGLSELNEKLMLIVKEKIPGIDSEDFNNPDLAYLIGAIYKWIIKINPEAKELHRRVTQGIIPKEGILIKEVLMGGPMEKAGFSDKKGWHIVEVDEKKLEDMPLEDALKLIRGLSGTKVKLILAPPEELNKMPISIEITRGMVETSAVLTARIVAGKIGYIKFGDFYENVNSDLQENISRLKTDGMEKLILDLRNNPGGNLNEADKILEALLPAGRIAIYSLGKDNRLVPFYSLPESEKPKIFSGKIAVLINENSASASELVAISLREQTNAAIVGKKSFGKGTIQALLPLPDNSALRLTIAHYISPVLGKSIEGKGVLPDVEIVDNPDTAQDEVIQKAIEILEGALQ